MFLYLVHHGDALDPGIDAQRSLSEQGQRQAEHLAAAAAARGVRPAVIWHSGKLRARQTAEAFSRACNPLADFSAQRGLQPTDPPEGIRTLLVGETRDIMLVGHLPNLPRVRHALMRAAGAPDDTAFPAHGMIALESVGEVWIELWRLAP